MTSAAVVEPLRWVEVSGAAIEHNTATVRSWVDEGCGLMAMVKSEGYGHGAVRAARAALRGGATWLGVYTPDEALALRTARIDAPLLVAGHSPKGTLPQLVAAGIDVTVFDAPAVRALAAAAVDTPARCHIKVDTGLGRIGVAPPDLPELLGVVREVGDTVSIAGVFTHFADTAAASDYTTRQDALLCAAAERVHELAPNAVVHAAGTAAIVERPDTHHDMVRPGIALYGYTPPGVRPRSPLRPAMSVLARIVQVKWVPPGTFVGYGRTWQAGGRRRIATVAIGYAQGLSRALSNRGEMVVAGQRCPIAGTVSMDQVTVDVTGVPGVEQGGVAMLFGERDGARLGADETAEAAGTISYELLCRAGLPARHVRDAEGNGSEDGRMAAVP